LAEYRSIGGLENSPYETIKQGKNYLFAVGINKYQHFTPLSNASKDIEDLAAILKEFYEFDHQEILLDENATRSNIINKLNDLPEKVSPEDKLLIYYSGHGKLEENDSSKQRGYWIPVDGKPDDVSSYVTNADVRDIIKTINARHILLISDSCFSASLLVTGRSADSYDGAYEDMERSKSRWAFISGKGVVSDGDSGQNSPFAQGIMKQLKRASNKINISLLADQVTKDISLNYEQQAIARPIFATDSDGGQFVFVKKQTEKDDWENALQQNTEGAFLAYLKKYPNGKFAKDADDKLIDIADEGEWESATLRDKAFSYRQYLKSCPAGKHVSEANKRLDEIAQEDQATLDKANAKKQEQAYKDLATNQEQIDKEAKRKQEQERVFQIEKERKEKELADQQKQKNKVSVVDNNPKLSSGGTGNKVSTYYYLIALVGVLLFGWFLFNQKSKTLDSQVPGPVADTTVTKSDITVPVDTRQMEGFIMDLKEQTKPLPGSIVLNKRTGTKVTADEKGHFVMELIKDDDSLVISNGDDYLISNHAVQKDQKTRTFYLEARIKTNKTITGKAMDKNGLNIRGAWVYVRRNGQIIQPYTHTNNSGEFKLTKVNEGDILNIDTGKGKFAIIVGNHAEYNLEGSEFKLR
jgi:hypothetical protein